MSRYKKFDWLAGLENNEAAEVGYRIWQAALREALAYLERYAYQDDIDEDVSDLDSAWVDCYTSRIEEIQKYNSDWSPKIRKPKT